MELKRCSVLVTGGAVRIGRAICERMAGDGAEVVIHCNRSQGPAEALARRIRAARGRAAVVVGDLVRAEDCERVVAEAFAATRGRLNALVNNASVFNKESLLASTPESVGAEFAVNLFAPMNLTRAFARGLSARRRRARGVTAAVVNLLDRRVAGNEAGCLPYLLSKKALADFTRSAALELAPRIAVNGVAPGAILPPPGRPEVRVRDLAGMSPLGRLCTPADIAAAVAYLLGQKGVTGQILFVDGGQHLLGGMT